MIQNWRFEEDLARFTAAKFAIATSNGTAALHICFLLAGVKAGDEVLVPSMTFVGTTNAIAYCGAIPHFIDAEEKHLGIDFVALDHYLANKLDLKHNETINKETKRPVRALCVMHTLGHPVDLEKAQEISKKYNIVLVEDAAEALGSYYRGTHVGHYGLVGALSFNGNKVVTTGGGGAILTNDPELAKHAKYLTTTAKQPHPWLFAHNQIAYNYRLPNINAALGCAQLEQLPKFLENKRKLAEKYQKVFEKIAGVRVITEPAYARSNYWLNAIALNDAIADQRDALLLALTSKGVMSRPLWNLQNTLPMYRDCPSMSLPVAKKLYKQIIKLPSSPQLICQVMREEIED